MYWLHNYYVSMSDIDLHIWESKFKLHTYHVINGDDNLQKGIDWKIILET